MGRGVSKTRERNDRCLQNWTVRQQADAVANNPRSLIAAVDWLSFGLPYCTVYVVTTQDQWPCKIGFSSAPLKRIVALQTSHWKRLIVWGGFWASDEAGARKVEGAVHSALEAQGKALLGEWFDIKPEPALETVERLASEVGVAVSDDFPSPEVRDGMVALATQRLERRVMAYPVRVTERFGVAPARLADNQRVEIWARTKEFDIQPEHCRKELLADRLRREEKEQREFMRGV